MSGYSLTEDSPISGLKGYKRGRFLDKGSGYESGFKEVIDRISDGKANPDGFIIQGYGKAKGEKGKQVDAIYLTILDTNLAKMNKGELVTMPFRVDGFIEYVKNGSFKFNDEKAEEILAKYEKYFTQG